MTNSFHLLNELDLPTNYPNDWWNTYYPNAGNFILNNALNVYVLNESSYSLRDPCIINDNNQNNSFIIDKNKHRYGLLSFDQNSFKETRICYFYIVGESLIPFFNEDLKNQILNHTILQ